MDFQFLQLQVTIQHDSCRLLQDEAFLSWTFHLTIFVFLFLILFSLLPQNLYQKTTQVKFVKKSE
jgi:hypothetical protein